MQRAQKRDAIHSQKFFFRKHVLPQTPKHSQAYEFYDPQTPSNPSSPLISPSLDESMKQSSHSRSISDESSDCGCGCHGPKKESGSVPYLNLDHVKVNGAMVVDGDVHQPEYLPAEKIIEALVDSSETKETALRNCFPEVTMNTQPPAEGENDERRKVPIEEEYEEMSIEEIIAGKVSLLSLSERFLIVLQ